MKTAMTLAMTVALTWTTLGALAASGETAVSESRAALNELWGRTPTQAVQAVQHGTEFDQNAFNAHIARSQGAWSDNHAAGRKHEPAGHDGR